MKVPKKIIYQMDLQIQEVERRIAKLQKHLAELKKSRDQMEPIGE